MWKALATAVLIIAGGAACPESVDHARAGTALFEIAGTAGVIDGDTISVMWHGAEHKVRLEGIDALEAGQQCGAPPWACGSQASELLIRLADKKDVTCRIIGTDIYKRWLGQCWLAAASAHTLATSLNAVMVDSGLAFAFRRYSLAYVAHEEAAHALRRGAWSGDFQFPWDYRAERRQQLRSRRRN
ncbi:MAG: thermonuclease family protein [Bacteroidota bacterium]